jgi:hypothetical protein
VPLYTCPSGHSILAPRRPVRCPDCGHIWAPRHSFAHAPIEWYTRKSRAWSAIRAGARKRVAAYARRVVNARARAEAKARLNERLERGEGTLLELLRRKP